MIIKEPKHKYIFYKKLKDAFRDRSRITAILRIAIHSLYAYKPKCKPKKEIKYIKTKNNVHETSRIQLQKYSTERTEFRRCFCADKISASKPG